jgi:hypothetical protein
VYSLAICPLTQASKSGASTRTAAPARTSSPRALMRSDRTEIRSSGSGGLAATPGYQGVQLSDKGFAPLVVLQRLNQLLELSNRRVSRSRGRRCCCCESWPESSEQQRGDQKRSERSHGKHGSSRHQWFAVALQALKHRRNVKKFNVLPSRRFATRSRTFINPPGLGWSLHNHPQSTISKVWQF